jgi:hypothetical protein
MFTKKTLWPVRAGTKPQGSGHFTANSIRRLTGSASGRPAARGIFFQFHFSVWFSFSTGRFSFSGKHASGPDPAGAGFPVELERAGSGENRRLISCLPEVVIHLPVRHAPLQTGPGLI